MANEEHVRRILKQTLAAWHQWRLKNPGIVPNLSRADLSGADLFMANLSAVNLRGADLSAVNLRGADLFRANLSRADLSGADLGRADLGEADLTGVDLAGVNLTGVDLRGAQLQKAVVGGTIFANIDLSKVQGLNSVQHIGPSTIGIDTLYRSRGNIPERFLRGCGVPDDFITNVKSLTVRPIEYYSCFISYSSKDNVFAGRLYADLQRKKVRCWFAPEDLKIGEKIRVGIDESIRMHDKLLLVLSRYSVASDWVEKEVETAFERERKQKRTVLFPIRLDDTVLKMKSGWPADIQRTRHIGDFRRWKSPDTYQKAFDRLLRDLKAGESGGSQ
jgi:hypothetical protein